MLIEATSLNADTNILKNFENTMQFETSTNKNKMADVQTIGDKSNIWPQTPGSPKKQLNAPVSPEKMTSRPPTVPNTLSNGFNGMISHEDNDRTESKMVELEQQVDFLVSWTNLQIGISPFICSSRMAFNWYIVHFN